MKGLLLKNNLVNPPLFLAPMAGLSEAILRRTIYNLGSLGMTVTELIPIEGLLRGNLKLESYVSKKDLHFTALQFSGFKPERFLEAGKMAVEYGAKFIDINMGCPVPKITKSGSGSALLKEPVRVREIATSLSP